MGLKIISGIECVRILGKNVKCNIDVIDTTDHYHRYEEDFLLAKEMGIKTLRIGVPWHKIEEIQGNYDWEWFDKYMSVIRELQIEPILDPLHHVSVPDWLEKGFLDSRFVPAYVRFFTTIVQRYPWVTKYTIVNEPTITTHFSTNAGIWFPFETGVENHKKALDNIYRVIYGLSFYLRHHRKEHWFVDSCEHHYGTCESSSRFAEYKNNVFRFELLDRLLFCEDPCPITVLGLDYYSHSEFEWSDNGRNITSSPVGYAEIVNHYRRRYNIPIAMTETNIRGTVEDRQTWFVHAYKECIKAGVDTICWYPLIDSTDWCSLITECNRNIDPQGIIWLDKDLNRHKSEFFDTIKRLNLGEISIDAVKTYEYGEFLKENLKGFK